LFQEGKIGTKAAIEISQMRRKIGTFAAMALLVFGCSRSGKVTRSEQQYQVVQEGSASGVTSTINGPGETPPPMTNTNADTTTNLTLPTNPNPMGTDTIGSMASSMPSYPSGTPGMPPASRPRPITHAPVVTDTIGSTTPPMPKEHAAPPREQTDTSATDTTTAAAPPTETTDTTSTTTTSSDTKKKDDAKKKDEEQPTPPPPPPPTDTRG
jgi:hypothetical protein